MSYTIKDMDREINEKIDEYGADSGIEKLELIAQVVSEHSEISGEDEDCARCCVLSTVTVRVERAFRNIKKQEKEPDDNQQTLPGYEHIQERYIVDGGNGDLIAIHADRMTSEQLRRKAEQLSSMARGLNAHADELLRYARETGRGW